MSTKTLSVKVHLYEVVEGEENSVEITDVLNNLEARGQAERIIDVNGYPMKMEKLESLDGLLCANFCKYRYVGPGKSSKDQVTTPFDLKDNEFFGETTAALLTEDKKHVLVWYNHYGVRATAIAHYLTEWISREKEQWHIEFQPVLKQNVFATIERADSLGAIKAKFDFTNIAIGSYSGPVSKILGTDGPWYNIHRVADSFDGSTQIECKIIKQTGKYKEGMDRSKGIKYANDLWALSEENIVTSAEVEVRYTDAPSEMLDLLKAREFKICKIEASRSKRMIDFDDSKVILMQAYDYWKGKGKIETNHE